MDQVQAAELSSMRLELGHTQLVIPVIKPFDPVSHDLDAKFRLTKFADLKGWGCKVPQDVLLKLLEGLKTSNNGQDIPEADPVQQFMQPAVPVASKIGE